MSSSYRLSLENWLKSLDVRADSVLDVGGSQNPVSKRVNSWEVEEYKILDLEQPHEEKAKVDIVHDINKPFVGQGDIADVIFCLEVAEYLWNPYQALCNLSKMLKHGGTLYMSFPSVYPVHNPIDFDTLRYMPRGVEQMANKAGLRLVNTTYRRFEGSDWIRLISQERLRAAKNEDINFSGFIMEFTK